MVPIGIISAIMENTKSSMKLVKWQLILIPEPTDKNLGNYYKFFPTIYIYSVSLFHHNSFTISPEVIILFLKMPPSFFIYSNPHLAS